VLDNHSNEVGRPGLRYFHPFLGAQSDQVSFDYVDNLLTSTRSSPSSCFPVQQGEAL